MPHQHDGPHLELSAHLHQQQSQLPEGVADDAPMAREAAQTASSRGLQHPTSTLLPGSALPGGSYRSHHHHHHHHHHHPHHHLFSMPHVLHHHHWHAQQQQQQQHQQQVPPHPYAAPAMTEASPHDPQVQPPPPPPRGVSSVTTAGEVNGSSVVGGGTTTTGVLHHNALPHHQHHHRSHHHYGSGTTAAAPSAMGQTMTTTSTPLPYFVHHHHLHHHHLHHHHHQHQHHHHHQPTRHRHGGAGHEHHNHHNHHNHHQRRRSSGGDANNDNHSQTAEAHLLKAKPTTMEDLYAAYVPPPLATAYGATHHGGGRGARGGIGLHGVSVGSVSAAAMPSEGSLESSRNKAGELQHHQHHVHLYEQQHPAPAHAHQQESPQQPYEGPGTYLPWTDANAAHPAPSFYRSTTLGGTNSGPYRAAPAAAATADASSEQHGGIAPRAEGGSQGGHHPSPSSSFGGAHGQQVPTPQPTPGHYTHGARRQHNTHNNGRGHTGGAGGSGSGASHHPPAYELFLGSEGLCEWSGSHPFRPDVFGNLACFVAATTPRVRPASIAAFGATQLRSSSAKGSRGAPPPHRSLEEALEPVVPLGRIWEALDAPYGTKIPFEYPVALSPFKHPDDAVFYEPFLSAVSLQRVAPGSPCYTWYAPERPENRRPILDQIELLAETECPALGEANTTDLTHQSWFSVLWQPVYCHHHTSMRSCGAFLCFYVFRPARHLFRVPATTTPPSPRAAGSSASAVPPTPPPFWFDNCRWDCPVFRVDLNALGFDYWTMHSSAAAAAAAGGGGTAAISKASDAAAPATKSGAPTSSTCGGVEDGAANATLLADGDPAILPAAAAAVATSPCLDDGDGAPVLPWTHTPLVGMMAIRPRCDAWYLPNDTRRTAFTYHAPLFLTAAALQLMRHQPQPSGGVGASASFGGRPPIGAAGAGGGVAGTPPTGGAAAAGGALNVSSASGAGGRGGAGSRSYNSSPMSYVSTGADSSADTALLAAVLGGGVVAMEAAAATATGGHMPPLLASSSARVNTDLWNILKHERSVQDFARVYAF